MKLTHPLPSCDVCYKTKDKLAYQCAHLSCYLDAEILGVGQLVYSIKIYATSEQQTELHGSYHSPKPYMNPIIVEAMLIAKISYLNISA